MGDNERPYERPPGWGYSDIFEQHGLGPFLGFKISYVTIFWFQKKMTIFRGVEIVWIIFGDHFQYFYILGHF